MQWEQAHLDSAVVDLFGFHALQLGWPELDALRANRMPHRWVATERPEPFEPFEPHRPIDTTLPKPAAVSLHCDFDALPFDSASLDLVVLPHVLETSRDPHRVLREVDRVLMPEGRAVIVGFNPSSPWGLRQRLGRWRHAGQDGAGSGLFLPGDGGGFLRYGRLRDWLRLLGFEVEAGRFGCYRLPVSSPRWLERLAWMDGVGERWWPVFGAVYFVVAVKRVRGMRLVGTVRSNRVLAKPAPAPVVAAQRGQSQSVDRYEKEPG